MKSIILLLALLSIISCTATASYSIHKALIVTPGNKLELVRMNERDLEARECMEVLRFYERSFAGRDYDMHTNVNFMCLKNR
jgi:hypothetical protein